MSADVFLIAESLTWWECVCGLLMADGADVLKRAYKSVMLVYSTHPS